MSEAYPELAVEICETSFTDPFGQVRERYYDVQFMELPVREDDLAKGPTLLTEGRVLAVAADHPLAARPWLTMEDLSATDLVAVEGDMPDYRREVQAPTRTPNGRPIGSGPAVTSLQEALMLVAGGRGALLTGAHTAVYQPRPGVVYLEVVDAPPVRYGLVWRAGEDTDAVKACMRQVAVEAEAASAPAIVAAALEKSPALVTE